MSKNTQAKAKPKPLRISRPARKAPAAVETRCSIAEQTAAFLKSGGEITEVPRGVSGQQRGAGPRSAARRTTERKPATGQTSR